MRWAWAAAGAVAVVDSVLAAGEAPWARKARRLTKPALVPAVALATRSGGRPSRTLGVALAGSWVGDMALLSRSDAGLLGGVGGFTVAHVAYLAEIRRQHGPAPRVAVAATPGTAAGGSATAGRVAAGTFAAAFAGAGAVLWRRLDTPAERRLRVPVVGYAALVSRMGAAAVRAGLRAGGPAGRALALGGMAFVVSDGLVAWSQFGPRRSRAVDAAVMATYAVAQALIAGSLAGSPADPVSRPARPRACGGRARPRRGAARCRWSRTAR